MILILFFHCRKRKREVLSDSGSDVENKKQNVGEEKDDGQESEKDLVSKSKTLLVSNW